MSYFDAINSRLIDSAIAQIPSNILSTIYKQPQPEQGAFDYPGIYEMMKKQMPREKILELIFDFIIVAYRPSIKDNPQVEKKLIAKCEEISTYRPYQDYTYRRIDRNKGFLQEYHFYCFEDTDGSLGYIVYYTIKNQVMANLASDILCSIMKTAWVRKNGPDTI